MNQNLSGSSSRRARGFTLVEALVALLALSIGLLGIAAMQMSGLKSNLSAAWRSQATYLAYDIIDRMRANRSSRTLYATGPGAPPTPGGTVTLDLQSWRANVQRTLPSGTGTVALSGPDNTIVTVTVQWDDSRGTDPNGPLIFTTRSRL